MKTNLNLDDIWRLSRWIVYFTNCTKDKTSSGISLKPFQLSPNLNEIKIDQSPSLASSLNSNEYLIKQNINCFINNEDNTIELTLCRSLLTSNTYIFHQQDIFFKSNPLLHFA
ncbi:unnamed protein product [Rotaria sp. Silwood2]|nr:unnamed protein product [Rotaria sp. Silwood2]CAF4521982.1 unnamed protein product [Rotaria sp. Silwood2]